MSLTQVVLVLFIGSCLFASCQWLTPCPVAFIATSSALHSVGFQVVVCETEFFWELTQSPAMRRHAWSTCITVPLIGQDCMNKTQSNCLSHGCKSQHGSLNLMHSWTLSIDMKGWGMCRLLTWHSEFRLATVSVKEGNNRADFQQAVH